jgi:hypothetical protein
MITVRKIARSAAAAMPGWQAAVCALFLLVPLARLAALLLTAGLCLIQPARVRRAASAWKGGKSHRYADRQSAPAAMTFSPAGGSGGESLQVSP